MKKGREWLTMLPTETQIKWFRESIQQKTKWRVRFTLDFDFETMERFIYSSFMWEKTKDGFSFWEPIANNEQYK